MTSSTSEPREQRRWRRFHLWQMFLLLTGASLACASVKCLLDRRDFLHAKAKFYDAIESNELLEVQALLRRYPALIRSTSPPIRTPGGLTVIVCGETPVSVAVLFQSRETFDYLLTLRPDLSRGSAAGTPPLIWATCADDIHYLEALVNQGADCSVRDERGKTAADYARQFGKQDFVELLAKQSSKQTGQIASKAASRADSRIDPAWPHP